MILARNWTACSARAHLPAGCPSFLCQHPPDVLATASVILCSWSVGTRATCLSRRQKAPPLRLPQLVNMQMRWRYHRASSQLQLHPARHRPAALSQSVMGRWGRGVTAAAGRAVCPDIVPGPAPTGVLVGHPRAAPGPGGPCWFCGSFPTRELCHWSHLEQAKSKPEEHFCRSKPPHQVFPKVLTECSVGTSSGLEAPCKAARVCWLTKVCTCVRLRSALLS